MSRRQLPRTTAAILDAATFLPGEIAVDTTNDELRYDGDGSTVGGIVVAKKSASAQLADSNVFTGAVNRFKRIFISAADAVYDLAANVLGTLIYFSSGGTITVAANKEFNALRHDETFSIGSGGIAEFAHLNYTAAAASDASSNMRGFVANLLNAGPGTISAMYARAELSSGGTGDIFAFKSALKTRTGVNNAYNRQVANDTDTSGTVDAIDWFTSVSATPTLTDYGILADTKVSVAQSFIQYAAVGTGEFWKEKNSTASADLAYLDETGKMLVQNIELGHLTDTTITRASAGDIAIEGNIVYRAGGTDVALTDGGTGASTARGACANLAAIHVLAADAPNTANTGNTSENTLATIAVPASAMGPNGFIRITVQWRAMTSSANNKTARIKFGGTEYHLTNFTTVQSGRTQIEIHNVNSASSQVGTANNQVNFGGASNDVITSAHNTDNSQDITITAQLASSGENMTLASYTVELFYKA